MWYKSSENVKHYKLAQRILDLNNQICIICQTINMFTTFIYIEFRITMVKQTIKYLPNIIWLGTEIYWQSNHLFELVLSSVVLFLRNPCWKNNIHIQRVIKLGIIFEWKFAYLTLAWHVILCVFLLNNNV